MHLLSDIITYVRRIIKSPSNAVITDNLIIDYINRFYLSDVSARMELFDLKTTYQFQTAPGVDRYNMPLYNIQTQPGGQNIAPFPVYQGFTGTCRINGVPVSFNTRKEEFFGIWANYMQQTVATTFGDGTSGPYTLRLPFAGNNPNGVNQIPSGIIRGHIDMSGIIAVGNNPVQDPLLVTTLDLTVPVTSVNASVYITTVSTTGASVVVSDSGQFFVGDVNIGLLMAPGAAPFGNLPLPGGYETTYPITGVVLGNPTVITAVTGFVVGQRVTIDGINGTTELNGNTYTVLAVSPTTVTLDVDSTLFTPYILNGTISSFVNFVNYFTGEISVIFPVSIPQGQNIYVQCIYYNPGLPRSILFYDNVITLRSPPDKQYLVEMDAYLTPAAFLSTGQAASFGYMCEYIARGAARKILADTGDMEQFAFYEPLFIEQEMLVWKRSQRQNTATRVPTIYSAGHGNGQGFYGSGWGGAI